MANSLNYIWLILLAIYIISPFDAHPLFLDDLIASGVLFYIIYRNSRHKKQQQQYYSHSSYSQSQAGSSAKSAGPLNFEAACKMLGVSASSSLDDVSRAYRDKMSRSHPDKVSHLSEELQDKAKELALRINEAYEVIKRSKGK